MDLFKALSEALPEASQHDLPRGWARHWEQLKLMTEAQLFDEWCKLDCTATFSEYQEAVRNIDPGT